jgi:2-aminomuconate deaminase
MNTSPKNQDAPLNDAPKLDPISDPAAILEDAGSTWANIVDVTVYLTNLRDDFAIFNRLYAEHFADCRPARTTVEVNCLPTPIAIELKVIATI